VRTGFRISRAEYIRVAIRRMNRKTAARLRAERLAEFSLRVREESMRVNAELPLLREIGCLTAVRSGWLNLNRHANRAG